MAQKTSINLGCGSFPYTIIAIITAVIAYHLNSGWLTPVWMFLDAWLWPIAWVKWICFGEITKELLRQAFPFLY